MEFFHQLHIRIGAERKGLSAECCNFVACGSGICSHEPQDLVGCCELHSADCKIGPAAAVRLVSGSVVDFVCRCVMGSSSYYVSYVSVVPSQAHQEILVHLGVPVNIGIAAPRLPGDVEVGVKGVADTRQYHGLCIGIVAFQQLCYFLIGEVVGIGYVKRIAGCCQQCCNQCGDVSKISFHIL